MHCEAEQKYIPAEAGKRKEKKALLPPTAVIKKAKNICSFRNCETILN